MKVYGALLGRLSEIPEQARFLDSIGFDGGFSAETTNDPFMPLVLAAEHSEKIDLMTSIAVAFARNPMTLAVLGHDLNSYSQGRFILGLGSQIEPHITKRFSMPWSQPAARMRELMCAIRAIWDCWYEGKPLDFRGEFYTHTLMTPMFTPTDTRYGPPRIMLAAVGPLMTQVAGEVADGLVAHGFTTRRYFEQVTLPVIEKALVERGRERRDFEIVCPVFVVSGSDEESFENSRRMARQQLAFYGSTPAYRSVLELHGWGELQSELNTLSKQGKWVEMGTLISDEMLETFAIVAEPASVASNLCERYGKLIDGWLCTFQPESEQARREMIQALRA